ncbi:hypothetical protein [Pseudomonas synxantha]|uniref:hypothetical protein n=1 Tax=Pseudomonas synxantha TaxID=47883 RepID=UPI001F155298|nr:hypothetical protein [Pseudomonas synxantha]
MRILFVSLFCFFITACSSNPATLFVDQVKNSQTPLALTPVEAMHISQAVPMPVDPVGDHLNGKSPPQNPVS